MSVIYNNIIFFYLLFFFEVKDPLLVVSFLFAMVSHSCYLPVFFFTLCVFFFFTFFFFFFFFSYLMYHNGGNRLHRKHILHAIVYEQAYDLFFFPFYIYNVCAKKQCDNANRERSLFHWYF